MTKMIITFAGIYTSCCEQRPCADVKELLLGLCHVRGGPHHRTDQPRLWHLRRPGTGIFYFCGNWRANLSGSSVLAKIWSKRSNCPCSRLYIINSNEHFKWLMGWIKKICLLVFQATEIEPLEESTLYQEDWLGLRQLREDGLLHRLVMEGDHMNFQPDWFKEWVIDKFLKKIWSCQVKLRFPKSIHSLLHKSKK